MDASQHVEVPASRLMLPLRHKAPLLSVSCSTVRSFVLRAPTFHLQAVQ
jgi:hypothetical protein